ncbi:MAG: hypothetical protein M5T52_19775 [Ignavibacteriaceae bacterium]|nr:hypothetical protein [Ignavibacteriaceae bacterium]
MQFDHFNFNKDNTIDVFISESDFTILQSTGFNYEILIDDWYTHYANLPKMSEAEKNAEAAKSGTGFWNNRI